MKHLDVDKMGVEWSTRVELDRQQPRMDLFAGHGAHAGTWKQRKEVGE